MMNKTVNQVTAANVTGKALKRELFEQTSTIEYALSKIEKANLLLDLWTQEYSFSKNPDPQTALEHWGGVDKGLHGTQSSKWFYEYDRIFHFVDMAFDYILEAQQMLEETVSTREQAEEQRKKEMTKEKIV